jgi:acetolactate synthase-1/2/3 large subunit
MKNYLDGGDAILEAFRKLGIDYIICSPGSEWSPIWEALARADQTKTPSPGYIDCWHETLAIGIALGYTRATGRLQAVLLHSGVGLMQGSMGMHSARMGQVPMLIMSGEALSYGEAPEKDPGPQWYRNLSFVGGPHRIVDPIVKWSNQVTSPETLYEMVMRAGEMAQRGPKGPTYLNVPVENMMAQWNPPPYARMAPPAPRTVSPEADIETLTDLLAAAKFPVVLTEYAGSDPDTYNALVAFCEANAVAVIETRSAAFANFPKDHAMYAGADVNTVLAETDLALLVRARAPWYPPSNRPKKGQVVVIDESPFRDDMVYQVMGADMYLEGFPSATLDALAKRAPARTDKALLDARRKRAAGLHDALAARITKAQNEAATKTGPKPGLDPIWAFKIVSDELPEDTVYVDELTTHSSVLTTNVAWNEFGRYFYVMGGLGQGLGVALGVKLANRDKFVAVFIGDGSFLYNPVLQGLGASRDNDLPLLIVICNNKHYAAMFQLLTKFYPDGAAITDNNIRGSHINHPDFSHVAQAFGGTGVDAANEAELRKALQDGIATVKSGRSAIVNMILSR